jgi:6-hydroxymethylpterin diphosphokinase MptE-like
MNDLRQEKTGGGVATLLAALASPFYDTYSSPGFPSPKLAWHKFRYLAAGLGIGLTANDRALCSYRDKHRGRRAFLIGNGPSLNQCNLAKLAGETTFGVNGIFLNRKSMGFDPTYYVVEDVFVAEDRAEQIKNYRGPKAKFFGNYVKYCLEGAEDAIWMNVRYRFDAYPGFPHFSTNTARQLWVGGTVSYLCMQLAFFMGVSELILVGFDHNYIVKKDVEVQGNKLTSQSEDPNHFHPDYFGPGYRWHDPMLDRMEMGYRKARSVYEQHDRRIVNATVGGKLEVFDRVDYDALF